MEIKAWIPNGCANVGLLTHECRWTAFLKTHCDALFQTALLLSADPEAAELGMMAALGSVDTSKPPQLDELTILQRSVAEQSLKHAGLNANGRSTKARSLLQVGLWPVLAVDPLPRVCFVLRILLGYAHSWCAQTLGIDEQTVKYLLIIAINQLSFHSETKGDKASLEALPLRTETRSTAAGLQFSPASTDKANGSGSA